MSQVLVLSATRFEQERLASEMEEPVRCQVAGRSWRVGRLAGAPVRLVETGIGGVNAAHALTCALQACGCDWVLQVGAGGAYVERGLEVGDLALASEENYGDLGVRTTEGWKSAEEIGIPAMERGEERYFNRFPLEEEWTERALCCLQGAEWEEGMGILCGPFVTVQECSGTRSLGDERGKRFGGICESMEGAAAAHLCRLYGVPFVEVRGISNMVVDRKREDWNLPLAVERAQRAALILLENL